jgi:hypothetical protein
MFTIFLLLFRNYVIQMSIFIFYRHLKPHSEVWHYSSGHFQWYCRDFVLDSSFQFVCCLRPTFVDLAFRCPQRKKSQAGRSGEHAGHGMSPRSEIWRPWILSPCEWWHHPVGTTLLDFHACSVLAPGSCVTSAHNDLKLL